MRMNETLLLSAAALYKDGTINLKEYQARVQKAILPERPSWLLPAAVVSIGVGFVLGTAVTLWLTR